jgi:hypothetical protein
MNKIKRHIPGFVDHDEEDLVEVEFETPEELLAIEWVARWQTITGNRFIQYSKSDPRDGQPLLMVEVKDEMNEKRRWYVLGFLQDGDSLNLPICDTTRFTRDA